MLFLNIAASIEGWFSDYWSWKWIFWGTALLTPLMMVTNKIVLICCSQPEGDVVIDL
jgi:predicted MFS family arabinose efflux permease